MPGQVEAHYQANKDEFVDSIVLTVALPDAGYAVSYTGGLPAAGEAILGVARTPGEIGDCIPVTRANTTSAITGAAIASVGLDLAVDAAGKFVPAVTGNQIVARSRDVAAATDEFITIQLVNEAIKP